MKTATKDCGVSTTSADRTRQESIKDCYGDYIVHKLRADVDKCFNIGYMTQRAFAALTPPLPPPFWAVCNYRLENEEGTDLDNPSYPFPMDGQFKWVIPNAEYSHVCYFAGTHDREWMCDKKDNYCRRLEREIEIYKQSLTPEVYEDHRIWKERELKIRIAGYGVSGRLAQICIAADGPGDGGSPSDLECVGLCSVLCSLCALFSCLHRELAKWSARRNYYRNRVRGTSRDNPLRPFPKDGKYSWEIPSASCCSRIRYKAGERDIEWMRDRDKNFLARLERESITARARSRLPVRVYPAGFQIIPFHDLTYGIELGRGGFGVVYQGEWQYASVAIKELLAPRLSADAMAEFRRETDVWGRLHHPNIMQLFGICVDEPLHCSMVMELMPKGSLYQVLHNGQPLSWEIRFHIAKDIAAGITYLHEQEILHCDLKSLNVLLDGTMRAKLTDFGLSKVKLETETTTASPSKGTTRWMSPELLDGKKANKESDIYSFGMLLWELASRKIPYEEVLDDLIVMGLIVARKKEKIPEECPEQYRGECSEKSRRDYLSYADLIARCWKERTERPTIQEAAIILEPLKEARTVLPGRPLGTTDGTPTPPRPLGKRAGGSGPSREAAAAPPPSGPVFKLGTGR